MKIAFWSEKEEAGTTFNMAAVACASVLLYPISAAVVPGGYEEEDLEKHFCVSGRDGEEWRQQSLVAEEKEYFVVNGMDYLLRAIGKVEITEQVLKKNMKQIVEERLYCLSSGKRQYDGWWDKTSLFQKMEQVVKKMENCFDVVFIDCGCQKNDFARRMLEMADVCVLNMRQDEEQIGIYYSRKKRPKGKSFFLLGNYFQEELYNRTNLQRIYRLDEKELGAIPYNVHLAAAGMEGKSQGYIKSQLQQGGGLEFEQELKRSTRLIMQLAGID